MSQLSFEEYANCVMDCFTSSPPFSINRIGGSDTNAVVDWYVNVLGGKKSRDEHYSQFTHQCAYLNGFFSTSRNRLTSEYEAYLSYIHSAYMSAEYITLCNWQWLRLFYPDELADPRYRQVPLSSLNDYIEYSEIIDISNKTTGPYTFFESIVRCESSFLRVMSKAMQGKSVLIVNPFRDLFVQNKANINHLFKNFSYGDINFQFYEPPVTYPGAPTTAYLHGDWFDVMYEVAKEIASLNADLILLSCGSYASPLCCILERRYKQSAVYVGGILQLYFGVIGGRWKDESRYADQLDISRFIEPRDFKGLRTRLLASAEPYNAYF